MGSSLRLAELAIQLAESTSKEHTAQEIVAFAAQTFETPHAGITLLGGGPKKLTLTTIGPTTGLVEQADARQHELREGPCVDSAVESRSVVSNDVVRDWRWPAWGPAVAGLGLASVLSSELHAGGRRVGALNVYGETAREFTREDVEVGQVLAHHASASLRATELIENLTVALDSRTVIGQAQGILMERYDLDADRAFAVMRRHSQDHNVKLVTLARQIAGDPQD